MIRLGDEIRNFEITMTGVSNQILKKHTDYFRYLHLTMIDTEGYLHFDARKSLCISFMRRVLTYL